MRRKKGFTLIELLVVISIIAMLLSILMPALNRVKKMAKLLTCKSQLRNLSTSTFTYATSNDDNLPVAFWQSSSKRTYSTWQSYVMKELDEYAPRPWGKNSEEFGTEIFGFGALWQQKLIEDPDLLICPGAMNEDIKQWLGGIESYTNRLRNFDEDWVERLDSLYSYMPLTKTPTRSGGVIRYWQSAKKASQLSSFSALCMDKMRSINAFMHTSGGGDSARPVVNVCFGDGHVVSVDNREFFTKEKVRDLRALPGNQVVPIQDLFKFLDTIKD